MAHQQRAEIFALPLRFRSYGADPFAAGESYKDVTPTEPLFDPAGAVRG
jgi:hypothetical protein